MKLKMFFLFILFSVFSFTPVLAISKMHHEHSRYQENAILGWIIVLDKNEIAAANEVSKKKVSPMVENYARWLHRGHARNLHETFEVSREIGEKPVKTEMALSLQEHGKKELVHLKKINNEEFQKAYIETMVVGHEEALNKLSSFIRAVKNPELKRHLIMTRNLVAHHLKAARVIQHKLNSHS